MSVSPLVKLKNTPNSISDWFEREYPGFNYTIQNIDDDPIDFNPYHTIIWYRLSDDYLHVLGFNYPMTRYLSSKRLKALPDYKGNYILPWLDTRGGEESLTELCEQFHSCILEFKPYLGNFFIAFILCQENEELNALLFPQLERRFFEETRFIEESSDESIEKWVSTTIPGSCLTHSIHSSFEEFPTFQDLHDFPNEPVEPKLWFKVKMIELPTEISDQLHLYKGGYMHLPRKYLSHWLWRRFLLSFREKKNLPEQLQYLDSKIRGYFRQKKQEKKVQVITDIEDLIPPCIEKIIKSNKFPKDTARNAMVRTLAQVDYPLEKIGQYLDELNERDPHERKILSSSQNRWDYKAVYEKKYAPVPCGMDICACQGENLEQKKLNCFKRFREKFPERHLKKLWGPIDWFRSVK
jgi:hypothetical protein